MAKKSACVELEVGSPEYSVVHAIQDTRERLQITQTELASGASQSYLVKFRSTFRTLLFLSLKEQGFSFFKMTFSEKDALLPYLFKLKL